MRPQQLRFSSRLVARRPMATGREACVTVGEMALARHPAAYVHEGVVDLSQVVSLLREPTWRSILPPSLTKKGWNDVTEALLWFRSGGRVRGPVHLTARPSSDV